MFVDPSQRKSLPISQAFAPLHDLAKVGKIWFAISGNPSLSLQPSRMHRERVKESSASFASVQHCWHSATEVGETILPSREVKDVEMKRASNMLALLAEGIGISEAARVGSTGAQGSDHLSRFEDVRRTESSRISMNIVMSRNSNRLQGLTPALRLSELRAKN